MSDDSRKRRKKPYAKPVVRSEKVFENAALSCGKCQGGGPTGQAACRSLKKFS